MRNDIETQAKRFLIWQELLAAAPANERQIIETDPAGPLSSKYSLEVDRRLQQWQKQRSEDD